MLHEMNGLEVSRGRFRDSRLALAQFGIEHEPRGLLREERAPRLAVLPSMLGRGWASLDCGAVDGTSPHDKRDHEEYQEEEEADSGDVGRHAADSTETEDSCDRARRWRK